MTDENIPEGEFAPDETTKKVKLGMATVMALSSILNVADYLFRNKMQYINDFKLAAVRQRGYGRRSGDWEYKACVWCLYAGVAFGDITSQVRPNL
ncbi:hypothetical protein DYB30_002993 [Aphanomyces astaci]|nr:hypothetical protein DYB30_002993 [Aphanomyces astaci]